MKTTSRMAVVATAALAAGIWGSASRVEATLLTYDGFDYPAGETLDGKDGGTGWDGVSWGEFLGGAAGLDIVAGGLTDSTGTLATSGNYIRTNSTQFSGRYPTPPRVRSGRFNDVLQLPATTRRRLRHGSRRLLRPATVQQWRPRRSIHRQGRSDDELWVGGERHRRPECAHPSLWRDGAPRRRHRLHVGG